jgi:hypothetical protein
MKKEIDPVLHRTIVEEIAMCESSIKVNNPQSSVWNVAIDPELKWRLIKSFAMAQDMRDCNLFLTQYDELLIPFPEKFEQEFIDHPDNRILVSKLQALYAALVTFYSRSFTDSDTIHSFKRSRTKHIPSELLPYHKLILRMRNNYVSHKDSVSEHENAGVLVLIDQSNKVSVKIATRRWFRFDLDQLPFIKKLVHENWLFASREVRRVKEEIIKKLPLE